MTVFEFVKEKYSTEPDYPWKDGNAVLRHQDNRKWYGVIQEISRRKLGLAEDTLVDVLNVKCDPILIGSLRMQEGFHPAYHMSKDKWISIRLDGSVECSLVKELIDLSYKLTTLQKARLIFN